MSHTHTTEQSLDALNDPFPITAILTNCFAFGAFLGAFLFCRMTGRNLLLYLLQVELFTFYFYSSRFFSSYFYFYLSRFFWIYFHFYTSRTKIYLLQLCPPFSLFTKVYVVHTSCVHITGTNLSVSSRLARPRRPAAQ